MKILLQSEAKTISNEELIKNQQYLINIWDKIFRFRFTLPRKAIDISTKI